MNIPGELLDSARIDGANNWDILIKIAVLAAAVAVDAEPTGNVGTQNSGMDSNLVRAERSATPAVSVRRNHMSTPTCSSVK